MLAVAVAAGEDTAGGTGGEAVTVMQHLVVTLVGPGTGLVAGRRLGATRDGWQQHTAATLTIQLFKTGAQTGLTMAAVTQLFAAMLSTAEHVVAQQRTNVVHVYAAQLVALVFATCPFLGTFLLAAGVVSAGGQFRTGDLLVHVAAATTHQSALITGGTRPLVTLPLAHVRAAGLAARE